MSAVPKRTSFEDVVCVLLSFVAANYPHRQAVRLSIELDDGDKIQFPVPARAPDEGAVLSFTPDGKTCWLRGRRLDFTDDQAPAALLLCRAFQDGTRDVPTAALLEAGESGCKNVRDLFRSCPAWQEHLIMPGERARSYRLLDPDEVPD